MHRTLVPALGCGCPLLPKDDGGIFRITRLTISGSCNRDQVQGRGCGNLIISFPLPENFRFDVLKRVLRRLQSR